MTGPSTTGLSHRLRIGVDVGGTFTDISMAVDGELLFTSKVLTTYDDFIDAVSSGLRECTTAGGVSELDSFDVTVVHGTTLVSNAYVQGKGGSVRLFCTRGFGDVLELAEYARFDVHDLEVSYTAPFVTRDSVREVGERVGSNGQVITELADDAWREFGDELGDAVAISFVNAYLNPVHEQAFARQVRDAYPGAHISISSDLAREAGEYARTVTTVANAFAQPIVGPYLRSLRQRIDLILGDRARLMIMLSNGGMCPAATAEAFPVRIAESGPAAGVTAAHRYLSSSRSSLHASEPLICLDMGGTTAKIAFVDPTRPLSVTTTIEVARDERHRAGSGLTLLVPSVDLVEIGAGGGSIARRDDLGLITVGPESAASDPGPAAYGKGGTEPTVTDACVLLGYIPAWQKLGGVTAVRKDLAADAVRTLAPAASADGGDSMRIALGIYRIADERMAGAVRVAAAFRGLQAREYGLLASGGAAPLHICDIAARLGITRVLIPPEPGVFSSLGLVSATEKYEASRPLTARLPLAADSLTTADELISSMRDEIKRCLEREDLDYELIADMRFAKQKFPIPVSLGDELPDSDVIAEAFLREYKRLYHIVPEGVLEVVTLRLVGAGEAPDVAIKSVQRPQAGSSDVPSEADVVFSDESDPSGWSIHRAAVIQRSSAVASGVGPALITEDHTTTVVPPGWSWASQPDGTIEIVAGIGGDAA